MASLGTSRSSLESAAWAVRSTQKELSKLLADADARLHLEVKASERDDDYAELRESALLDADPAGAGTATAALDGGRNAARGALAREHTLARLARAEARTLELEQDLADSNALRDSALAKAAALQRDGARLRELLGESLRSGEQCKHKMRQAEAFCERIGAAAGQDQEELLRMSEPPVAFEALKVEATHATELETTRVRLRQAQQEMERLRGRVEALTARRGRGQRVREERLREAEQLLASKHTQLLGAVRRVHYLLEQNERQQRDLAKKDAYINRLEHKLLELSRDLNELRAGHRKPVPPAPPAGTRSPLRSPRGGSGGGRPEADDDELEEDPIRVNWDYVFQQGTLQNSKHAHVRRARSPPPSIAGSGGGGGGGGGGGDNNSGKGPLGRQGMQRQLARQRPGGSAGARKRPTSPRRRDVSPIATSPGSRQVLDDKFERWLGGSNAGSAGGRDGGIGLCSRPGSPGSAKVPPALGSRRLGGAEGEGEEYELGSELDADLLEDSDEEEEEEEEEEEIGTDASSEPSSSAASSNGGGGGGGGNRSRSSSSSKSRMQRMIEREAERGAAASGAAAASAQDRWLDRVGGGGGGGAAL